MNNMTPTHIDQLVLFAYKNAHKVSASLLESHWAQKDVVEWADEGSIMITDLLMEDIPQFQLQARMSAISSVVDHLLAYNKLYDYLTSLGAEQKANNVWSDLSNIVAFEGFKKKVFQEEEKIMALFEYATDQAVSAMPSSTPSSLKR